MTPQQAALEFLKEYEHGWVRKREDGARARCGGAHMCQQCRMERLMLDMIEAASCSDQLLKRFQGVVNTTAQQALGEIHGNSSGGRRSRTLPLGTKQQ